MKLHDPYEMTRKLASPIVVITSSWKGKVNGMIANTAMRASLVPEVPRVMVIVSKEHLSHSMIWRSKAFAMHILRTDQMNLVKIFGLYSGRDKEKFEGIKYRLGKTGSPILSDAYAYFDCKVVNAMDTGAGTCFLADVVEGGPLKKGEIMTAQYLRDNLPVPWWPSFLRLTRKMQRYSARHIHNIDRSPWVP